MKLSEFYGAVKELAEGKRFSVQVTVWGNTSMAGTWFEGDVDDVPFVGAASPERCLELLCNQLGKVCKWNKDLVQQLAEELGEIPQENGT